MLAHGEMGQFSPKTRQKAIANNAADLRPSLFHRLRDNLRKLPDILFRGIE